MVEKIISRGAEALLYIEDGQLVKERIRKGYRIKEIDNKLRKLRTRSEAKLLDKAASVANVPSVHFFNDESMKIEMSYIKGKLVKDVIDNIDNKKLKIICNRIGDEIGGLHFADIVHGDLTTSNMILKEDDVYLIDFGLGFFSNKIEDKAVDLRLLRQALEAKHYMNAGKTFSYVLEGYEKRYDKSGDVLRRLKERVERRGRYKRKISRNLQ